MVIQKLNNFWLLIRRNATVVIAVGTVVPLVMALFSFVGPKIYNALWEPEYDFVYYVDKVPGRTNSAQVIMEKYLDRISELASNTNHPMPDGDLKVMKAATKELIKAMDSTPNEIVGNHIRIVVLTSKELDEIDFQFNGCLGYTKNIANPVSRGDIGNNPTLSPNGASYKYSYLKQGGGLELKIGFEDTAQCTAKVTASTPDRKQVSAKEVTADDYWAYQKQIEAGASRYFTFAITAIVLLLAVLAVWLSVIGLAYLGLVKRVAVLEQVN